MDDKRRAFRMGMCLNNIAQGMDDETYKRVKPWMDELEQGIVDLFEERKKDGSEVISGASYKD